MWVERKLIFVFLSMGVLMRDVRDFFDAGDVRLQHILKVMDNAVRLEKRLSFSGDLVRAAIYHDLGYAKAFAVTKFHPVDGAMLSHLDGQPSHVTDAVLHHTGAFGEMTRCRPDLSHHFSASCRMMATKFNRALTFCDLRAGAQGQDVSVKERLVDIERRHKANSMLLDNIAFYKAAFEEIDKEFVDIWEND
jgi:hypothetical protein